MINYVFILFLPGAAGNFFSRSLSLAGNHFYCFGHKDLGFQWDIDKKFKILSYENYKNFSNWLEFEASIHGDYIEHSLLENNSYSIWLRHPNTQILDAGIPGADDRQYVFYIDPGEDVEWMFLNSIYKRSPYIPEMLLEADVLLQDKNVHRISLTNIINCPESFISEIKKVLAVFSETLFPLNEQMMIELWHQWHNTTLKKEKFDNFKLLKKNYIDLQLLEKLKELHH